MSRTSPGPSWVHPAAAVLLSLVRRRTRPGHTLLVGIDGRSGAGKTLLSVRLADALGVPVVSMEDLYDGWHGLARGVTRVCTEVVAPLAQGRPANYRRFDWAHEQLAEELTLAPGPVVVVEGVGVTAGPCREAFGVRVWLEAPAPVRRARALGRAGAVFAPHWQEWAEQEERLFAGTVPSSTADLVVRTT